MSWKNIVKQDRRNNKVTIEYMINGEKKKVGPFPFKDFDKNFDAIPEEATNFVITEEMFSSSGESLGYKVFN